MAKSGFWLRGAKGKLAGSTIYTSAGETVMREIKGSIKNPKTKAQMIQRVISKTTMAQYGFLKPIANHSFEGKTAGKWCMARFATLNNKRYRQMAKDAQDAGQGLDTVFNFIPCGATKYIPSACVISEGSLPQIYTSVGENGPVVNVGGNTYEDVINGFGLQRGDQLTFVTVGKNDTGDYNFNVCRVILDPRNEDGTPAALSTPFIANGQIVKPSFRNEGNFTSLAIEDNQILFSMAGGDDVAAGVIASRQVDNNWLRSTCVLSLDSAQLADGDNISLEEAVAQSLVKTPIYTNAERYLNNAGVGGPQSEDAPESFKVSVNGGVLVDVTAGSTVTASADVQDIVISGYPSGKSLRAVDSNNDSTNFVESDGRYNSVDMSQANGEPIKVYDGETVILTVISE